MMKSTFFVFAVLLIAVTFALPRPDEPVATATKNDFKIEDLTKMLGDAFEQVKTNIESLTTKENMDKIQDVWADTVKKAQVHFEDLTKNTKKEETS